ncbi:hypothetical protein ACH437_00615 [Streptomyces xinghaiensis]|uniref:hypothetical protein n=1 Tax=Streptomyces xinghaiensis TaxID=1038928 RepID=UPI0037AA5776
MIEPSGIPQFTGDFEQLDKDVSRLRGDAIGIRDGGSDVHSRFQMLGAFYTAPEADALFSTTQPVMDKADGFAVKLETVADALDTFSVEARPLAKRLQGLKADAFTFVESVEGDEEWTYDEDKIRRHQELMDGVAAAESAFREAERRAATKISALVGGPKFVKDDGSHTSNKKTVMYGYDAEVLKHAEKTPWGSPVSESHHAWEVGYWTKSFFWDGLVVDNIWGGLKGLGTLFGTEGLDAAGDAWSHLGDVLSGIGQYTIAPFDALMDWAIGPDEESETEVRQKQAAKDFAKGLVAWDMWGENPARAASTVVFNGLTIGAGSLAARGAADAGAAAKVAGAAGKVGVYLDPVSAALTLGGKAAGALPKLSEVTTGVRAGVEATADAQRVNSVMELGNGAKLIIEDGRFIPVDKHGNVHTQQPRQELAADAQRTAPEQTPARDRELTPVGATSRTPDATAHTGQNLPPRAGHEPPSGTGTGTGGGDGTAPRGSAVAAPGGAGAAHAAGPETSARSTGTGGSGQAGNGHGGAGQGGNGGGVPGSGGHGAGGADDLGRAADDTAGGHTSGHDTTGDGTAGDGTAGVAGPDSGVPGRSPEGQRPAFMRDGANPYGPRGSLTLQQIEEIQVYRANNEPGYREHYYRKDGTRKSLEVYDESGFTPPQLTRLSDDAPWIRAKDVPAPPKPHFLDEDYISVGADTVTSKARLRILDEAAQNRHFAVRWDNIVADWKAETGRAHDAQGTPDSAAQWGEAKGTYKESHTAMGEAAEEFGESAARHHYVAERYPDFTEQPLLGPKNGNDQFDQVWKHEDGRIVVIEAKSSPGTELGRRTLPGGRQVSQGSREYFLDIMEAMKRRGEFELVESMEMALEQGKLEYAVVKGEKNSGTYTGYQYRRFDISKGTLP